MRLNGVVRVGTRASRLARTQTAWVVDRIGDVVPPGTRVSVKVVMTEGDRDRITPLPLIGGIGVFTDALEQALRAGAIDLAVHSLKDLPVDGADDVVVAAVCGREDVRDVLVARNGWSLATLPTGARVGSCSTRRTSQLRAARPDLHVADVRGNVDTRVARVMAGDYDAILLAAAGLHRLSMHAAISEYLPLERFLPAPGQGALAIQCRTSDIAVRRLIEELDNHEARCATGAERTFLRALGGGCAAPIAALANVERDTGGGRLVMRGLVASPDGRTCVRVEGVGAMESAVTLGERLAGVAFARGAGALLKTCLG